MQSCVQTYTFKTQHHCYVMLTFACCFLLNITFDIFLQKAAICIYDICVTLKKHVWCLYCTMYKFLHNATFTNKTTPQFDVKVCYSNRRGWKMGLEVGGWRKGGVKVPWTRWIRPGPGQGTPGQRASRGTNIRWPPYRWHCSSWMFEIAEDCIWMCK